jgi:peroxiredoxin
LRYPHLKDESKPVQAKYQIAEKKDLSKETSELRRRVEAITERSGKIIETPKVGHKLHV